MSQILYYAKTVKYPKGKPETIRWFSIFRKEVCIAESENYFQKAEIRSIQERKSSSIP